jgi:hypothetical protein
LLVDTRDGWRTEHPDAQAVHVEGDELVYERDGQETRLDLEQVRGWTVLEHHSGLERG